MIISRMHLAVCGVGFKYSWMRYVNTRTSVGRNIICSLQHSIGTWDAFEFNDAIPNEEQQILLSL